MITKENLIGLSEIMARQQKELEEFIKDHDMHVRATTETEGGSEILIYDRDMAEIVKQFPSYSMEELGEDYGFNTHHAAHINGVRLSDWEVK